MDYFLKYLSRSRNRCFFKYSEILGFAASTSAAEISPNCANILVHSCFV